MKEQAYEQLTLFREDSHVSHSLLPGNTEARRMTVTSGQRCLELYKNCGPLGSLVRMCLESSIWHSTRCFLTWKISATPRNRLLFQLAALMPHTEDTGSQFWPTPMTAWACTGTKKTLDKMAEKGLITKEEKQKMTNGHGGKNNPELWEWLMGYERKFTELIPTPRASDYKGAALNRVYSHNVQVERERERTAVNSAN